jgi:hypothetical protein
MRFYLQFVTGLLFGAALDREEAVFYLCLGFVVVGVSWRGAGMKVGR